jgi:hypothetical protein
MPDFSSPFETHEGKPIVVGDQKVTVISSALRFQLPGLAAGFMWNRPTAVRVQTEGAGEVMLPVVDETRQLEILLIVLGIISSILISALLRRR